MKILLIMILMLSHTVTFAQTKKLRWTDDLCEFEGSYSTKKYSERQLRDTLKLIEPASFRIETDATPRTIAGVKNISVAALDREYNLKLSQIKKLNLVKSAFWESVRQKKLSELEQVYQLSRTTMLAHENPSAIREYKSADSCVKKYAPPLINGGNDLLALWLEVNEDGRRKNGSPENVRRIYEQQFNSPDRLQYARIEVMTYGWWNCANQFIEYDNGDERSEREFKKLFTRVKTIACDEP